MVELGEPAPKVSDKITLPTTYEEAVAEFEKGREWTNKTVLKLADNSGWSVAHYMARRGHVFTDPEILDLKSNRKTSVRSLVDNFGSIL